MTIGEKLRVIRDRARFEIDSKLEKLVEEVYPILEGAAECGADCCEIKNEEIFESWKKLADENEMEVHEWCTLNSLEVEICYEEKMLIFSWNEMYTEG